jgi:hypothetical protein
VYVDSAPRHTAPAGARAGSALSRSTRAHRLRARVEIARHACHDRACDAPESAARGACDLLARRFAPDPTAREAARRLIRGLRRSISRSRRRSATNSARIMHTHSAEPRSASVTHVDDPASNFSPAIEPDDPEEPPSRRRRVHARRVATRAPSSGRSRSPARVRVVFKPFARGARGHEAHTLANALSGAARRGLTDQAARQETP